VGKTLFVSDVHLLPASPLDHEPFLRFLSFSKKDLEALYFLGDLFDYWIGPRHLDSADYREPLRALKDLSVSGAAVYLIPGNRDYLVEKRFERATGVRVLKEFVVREFAHRRVLLTHGDFVYNRNPKYVAYRRLMELRPIRGAYLSIPEGASRRIARGFRGVSRMTTSPFRWSQRDLIADARSHFRRGIEVLVCGHIHAPQHVRTEVQGKPRDIYILGDWDGGTQEYLEFDGAFRLKAWEGR